LLVSSRMTFQSRGNILSFIRFLNTQKIFSKNSCKRVFFFKYFSTISDIIKDSDAWLLKFTFSSSLLWKLSIRCWKWMSDIWRRRDNKQDTYSPCQSESGQVLVSQSTWQSNTSKGSGGAEWMRDMKTPWDEFTKELLLLSLRWHAYTLFAKVFYWQKWKYLLKSAVIDFTQL